MSNKTLELLFNSKSKVKVLKSLFRNSEKSFTVRELANLTQSNPRAIKKEIKILLEIGLLKVK